MADGIGVVTARQHVVLAKRHVAHVERILDVLVHRNRVAQIGLAERLLVNLEVSLRLAQDHLDREERKAVAKQGPAC